MASYVRVGTREVTEKELRLRQSYDSEKGKLSGVWDSLTTALGEIVEALQADLSALGQSVLEVPPTSYSAFTLKKVEDKTPING